jgi:hypothetical protein
MILAAVRFGHGKHEVWDVRRFKLFKTGALLIGKKVDFQVVTRRYSGLQNRRVTERKPAS